MIEVVVVGIAVADSTCDCIYRDEIILGVASLALLVASTVAAVVFLISGPTWRVLAAVALMAANGWIFSGLAASARTVTKDGDRDV